jgi:hypothetical protein
MRSHLVFFVLIGLVPKKEGGQYKLEMQQQNKDVIVCYNPATLELLGKAPVMSTSQVESAIRKGKIPFSYHLPNNQLAMPKNNGKRLLLPNVVES